jgi:hypothetical protein
VAASAAARRVQPAPAPAAGARIAAAGVASTARVRSGVRTLRPGGVANYNHMATAAPPSEAAAWTQGTRARTGAGTADVEEQGDYLPETPFLVRPLSATMAARTVTQARQDAEVERDFVEDFAKIRGDGVLPGEFADAILRAQELVRGYDLPRVHISIRDPVKCLRTFDYLSSVSLPTELDLRTNELSCHTNPYLPKSTRLRSVKEVQGFALLAAIGAVYYARLPSLAHVRDRRINFDVRSHFENEMRPCLERLERASFLAPGTAARGLRLLIAEGHQHLWEHARDTPAFVTPTPGLQEAFWNFVLSVHTRIPVLITGPPGW